MYKLFRQSEAKSKVVSFHTDKNHFTFREKYRENAKNVLL